MRRARLSAHAAALGGFTLLAVLHTWPLAAHLSTHLPGTHIGDNAVFAWNTWWMREALARPDASFLHTDALFAPGGASLVLHTHTALGSAIAALLPAGVIAATNLLAIACVALNGLSAFALALHTTGSRRAAVLAGVLFMSAPPLAARLMGHFNLLYAWTMVAAIGAFVRACETGTTRWAIAAAAAIGVVAWADYYLFVYTIVAIVRVALRVERVRLPVGARTAAAAAMTLAAVLAPLLWHALRLWLAGDYVSPPRLWRSAPAGMDLATLVMGPPWHPVTGAVTRAGYAALGIDVLEMSGWLGIVAPLLAFLAVRERAAAPARTMWLAVAVVFLVWAAGAFLRVGGVNTGILLPQQALRYVPVVANARMPARALIVVSLAAAMLAAIWARDRRAAVVWALGAAALLEQLVAPLPLAQVPRRSVDVTLAASAPGAVLEIPFGYRDGFGMRGRFDERALLGQIVHGHPIAGGFLARVPPSVERRYGNDATMRALMDAAASGPPAGVTCEAALGWLRASRMRYIVLTTDGGQTLYTLGERCPPSP